MNNIADSFSLSGVHPSQAQPSDSGKIVLLRILGNDLPPRHGPTQTIQNVKFILQHEKNFSSLRKIWLLNRITDERLQFHLLSTLKEAGHEVIVIPFNSGHFARLLPDFSHFGAQDFGPLLSGQILDDYKYTLLLDHAFHGQNKYLMNVNGARNFALEHVASNSDWIMPWDGNCFLHQRAWEEISLCISNATNEKYIIVPMERVTQNESLLDESVTFEALEEPQLIFKSDVLERFDEDLRYGRYSKVEFLRRIAFPGLWDGWDYQPWENRKWSLSTDAGRWLRAGWVARLSSGRDEYDEDPSIQGIRRRSNARRTAVRNFIVQQNSSFAKAKAQEQRTLIFDLSTLATCRDVKVPCAVREEILQAAGHALQAPLNSVQDKAKIAPSKDKRDYFSVAPFWWPNDATEDGLPYVRRDGVRNPESSLDDDASNQYDNTRLQQVFDRVTALSIAAWLSENDDLSARAEALIEKWFCGETAMYPSLTYAQVRRGHNTSAHGYGIIDAKDIYYFLDAVEMLKMRSALQPSTVTGLERWCFSYLRWLKNSPQGRNESAASNNHGTCYELQILALAKFVGQYDEVANSLTRSRARLFQQFDRAGSQPQEESRSAALHYRLFNLQCWLTLSHMFSRLGFDLMCDLTAPREALQRLLGDCYSLIEQLSVPCATAGVITHLSSRVHAIQVLGHKQWPQVIPNVPFAPAVTNLHPYLGVVPFWPMMIGDWYGK